MSINKGDLVRFKLGLYPDEEGLIYLVKEVNGDRCIIELMISKLAIHTTSVAKIDELHVYMESTQLRDFINNSEKY